VVIIIMTSRQEKPRAGKARPEAVKTPFLPGSWMEDLFAEIEGRSIKRRKTS